MTGKVAMTCCQCGEAFERYPSQVHGERAFCSRACLGRWRSAQTGPRAAHWKGGTRKAGQRVMWHLPWHHLADRKGYVFRYQIVAELMLRRDLAPEEVVHHDDEDQSNDHPGNLIVYASQAEHARHHGKQRSPEQMARMRAARRAA